LALGAALVGCGKVTDNNPIDAVMIDADLSGNATVVTQTVMFGGAIGANVGMIDIVSTLPNNEVLTSGATDAGGTATIKVYPGGSVTALYKHPNDTGNDLITWVGVKPGDTLTFGSRQLTLGGVANPALGPQTYTWPAVPAGTTSVQVFTSCGSSSVAAATTSIVLTESTTCHKEPMDIVFRALNASAVAGYGFLSNRAFSNGATVTLGAWTVAIPNATVNITGLRPEITSISGEFASVYDSTRQVFLSSSFYNGTPTGGAFSKTFPWHATGERSLGEVFLNRPGFNGMTLFDSFSSGTLAQNVAAPAFPAWSQGQTNVSSALRRADWYLFPDNASVTDGQVLSMSWSHSVNGTAASSRWDVILPPDQTSFEFPNLPAALADRQPQPEDFMGAFMTVFDVSSLSDYDMVRAQPSANLMCLNCAVSSGDFQRVVITQM
jgi:hypothetical protein